MGWTLKDIEEIVAALLGESRGRNFQTGVIMMMPAICKSQSSDVIIKATNYRRNLVERTVTNLLRHGIWSFDPERGPHWTCEWMRMFVDDVTEDEIDELTMGFICDVLVAQGRVIRSEDFRYTAIHAKGL